MTGDRSISVTLTKEEEYSDDESYQWSEDSDSDIDLYLSWEEDSVLSTDLDDDIDSEEEDSDLENLDEDMELATKNPQRRTTETLSGKSKEDKLLNATMRNLIETELILADDEELILIEEKTKKEEKGVSLTKTNRRNQEKTTNAAQSV